jgi:flavin reductase (DIM6/NTAB) family NADH-FMN oxidoreductase RutF
MDPPLVLVCVMKENQGAVRLKENGIFAVEHIVQSRRLCRAILHREHARGEQKRSSKWDTAAWQADVRFSMGVPATWTVG